MSGIINHLKKFNRHERFYLVGWALGNPTFSLDDDFRTLLNQKLQLEIPRDAFVAMDFTLDWLLASIFLPANRDERATYPLDGHLHATIEDVDLLVAYDDGPTGHIVMLEAKGRSSWSNSQLRSKARRLRPIFEHPRAIEQNVTPHFVIASPTAPIHLSTDDFPSWMLDDNGRLRWLKLQLPPDLLKPARCKVANEPSVFWTHWMVQPG